MTSTSIGKALPGLFVALLLSVCFAQDKQTPKPSNVPPSNPQLTAIEGRLAAIEGKVEPVGLDARLGKLEDAIRGLKPTPLLVTLLPSFIALLSGLAGVFIGGWNAERLQAKKAEQDLAASEKQAKRELGKAVVEFEIKQLSVLYGPLRALLGQSEALYREMNNVLIGRDSKRFQMIEKTGEQPQFQIREASGQWVRFRAVLHIPEVYGKGFGVEAYFDEIVAIGSEMVKIIKQEAGYARAEETDLMVVFGRYLAHFAVLKAIHDAAKQAAVPQAPAPQGTPVVMHAPIVNPSAAFPDTIHSLINQGFDAITKDVRDWRQRAAA